MAEAGVADRTGERIDPAAVRAYDIRGVAGVQVTAAGVRALGLGFATLARRQGLGRIAVARDGRLSSPELEQALVDGLVAGGAEVERLGLGTTPFLTYAAQARGVDGAVMVTASHNPAPENGLKLMLAGDRLQGADLRLLVNLDGRAMPGGTARDVEARDAYVEALAAAAAGMRPLDVVWDCGHGAAGPLVAALTARLPGRHVLLDAEVDGRFPTRGPDPSDPANLVRLGRAVRDGGFDLGFAFDGDGDRIGVVDASGEPLPADELLLFLAGDALRARPGAAVVGDVKSSRRLFEGVAALGGRGVMAPSGQRRVRLAMRREGAAVAGELSGHIAFDGWPGADDALYAAVRTLAALSAANTTLAAFRQALPPTCVTPEVRLAHPDAQMVVRCVAERVGATAQLHAVGGVRQESEAGWWLVRASGTEAKLSLRCEGATATALTQVETELWAHLAACGVRRPG